MFTDLMLITLLLSGLILYIGGVSEYFEPYFMEKKNIFLLAPPKQMSS